MPSRKDSAGHSVYRSRGNGEVRLNRVGTTLPSGKYCSKVPTLSGEWETMCINLSEYIAFVTALVTTCTSS